MANVTETSTWEGGIYQIETTDPVLGGPNGIANVQAKQLANRTKFLKERADQVDAAKGGRANLKERLDAIEAATEALGPDAQDATLAAIKPRQVYRRGPDLVIPSKAANQALTDKHRALRLTRI